MNIQGPYQVYEQETFEIKLLDKDGNPVNAFVVLKTPFHIPRIKYGSTVRLNAPRIYMRRNVAVLSEIIAFRLLNTNDVVKRDIVILNKE